MSNLKDRAINAVIWSLIERFGNQLVQFFIGLILARLLMPDDYGLVGMILIFISLSTVISEGGFSSALIRQTNVDEKVFSSVFWFNLVSALLCYIFLFSASSLIADFFKHEELELIIKISGLNIIINSVNLIPKTILIKKLNFKTQAKINLSSIIVSGLVGILMALNGMGYWALVFQVLIRNFLVSALFWIVNKWRPKLFFSRVVIKDLYRFGSNLMFSSIINTVSENLHAILIGKYFDAKSLGFYTRANQFQKLPVSGIYGAVSAVSYPILSELQSSGKSVYSGYQSMLKMIAFSLFPIMAILATISDSMIFVVLTEKWMPASEILKVLTIVGLFYPLHAMNLDILKVKGRSDLFLKIEILKQILNIITIIASISFGVIGLVWGSVILNVLCYVINSWYSKNFINYGILSQIQDLLPYFTISVILFLLMGILETLYSNQLFFLLTAPLIFSSLYLLIMKWLKIEEFNIFRSIFSKFFITK